MSLAEILHELVDAGHHAVERKNALHHAIDQELPAPAEPAKPAATPPPAKTV